MITNKISRWGSTWPWTPATMLAFAEQGGRRAPAAKTAPPYQLPLLPYAMDALEPFISSRAMSFHYGKHHQTYVDNLNKLTAGTPLAGQPLEQIVQGNGLAPGVFNNAAQVWNLTFFWNSMKGGGGGRPGGRLLELIERSFSSFDEFKAAFVAAGLAQFGSGWVWLVQDGARLKICKTANADTPVAHGQTALCTCDVWEHAYYLDYQNRRKDFLQMFVEHLVNWDFAASQLK